MFGGNITSKVFGREWKLEVASRGNRTKRRLIDALCLGAAGLAISVGGEADARDALTSSQALTYSDGASSIPYRLFQPIGFGVSENKFPLVIFLHGSGERGTNNTSQVKDHIQGLINLTETGNSAAYLIAPQAPAGSGWFGTPLRLVLDLVEQFAATRNVDSSRIYITGLSMGGFGTFEALENRPSLFAAAVPMSGGGDPAFALTYAQTPIWAFHGSADTSVPPSNSRNTITAIENAGGNLERYTELAGKGHVIWSPIYNGGTYNYDTNYTGTFGADGSGDMYSWMFAQQIPEPTTATLLICALALVGGRRRRHKSPV